jgi:hypothetical protein
MEIQQLNRFWVGSLIGLTFPLFCFSLYWLFFQRHVNIPQDDIRYLINKELMINVFKICCGTDLLFFYLGLNRKLVDFAKGIIASVLLYALVLAYLTFF